LDNPPGNSSFSEISFHPNSLKFWADAAFTGGARVISRSLKPTVVLKFAKESRSGDPKNDGKEYRREYPPDAPILPRVAVKFHSEIRENRTPSFRGVEFGETIRILEIQRQDS